MIDIHSHILPFLDDGPRSVDDAVAMCAMAARDGITCVAATPHMFCDVGNLDVERIRDACEALKDVLKARGVELDLRWAAEVRMQEDLLPRIKAGRIPFFDGGGRYLLLEPPMSGGNPEHLSQVIFDLQLEEITPVIAHPERCELFVVNPGLAQFVTDQGALLQVNGPCIVEALSGRSASPVADWIRDGLVHAAASDAHDLHSRPPLLSDAARLCAEALGAEEADRIFSVNPGRILAGEDVAHQALS